MTTICEPVVRENVLLLLLHLHFFRQQIFGMPAAVLDTGANKKENKIPHLLEITAVLVWHRCLNPVSAPF